MFKNYIAGIMFDHHDAPYNGLWFICAKHRFQNLNIPSLESEIETTIERILRHYANELMFIKKVRIYVHTVILHFSLSIYKCTLKK